MADSIRWFSPGEVAEITGVSVDLQRDWRRRGFAAFGRDKGTGRWQYGSFDVLGIAIAEALRRKHVDAFDAVQVGSRCNVSVALHLGLQKVASDRARVLLGERADDLKLGEGMALAVFSPESDKFFSVTPDNLEEVISSSFNKVINLKKLAEEVPAKVVDYLRDL